MHYTGMWAMQLPGQVTWSNDLVVASIVIGMLFASTALTLARGREGIRGAVSAAALLALAILSHHFTAMGAAEITLDPTRTIAASALSDTALAVTIAGAALTILAIALVGAITDRFIDFRTSQFDRARRELIADSEEKLREQHLRLDTALNNMSQGLCMFDPAGRLVLFNQRYLDIYGMSPDQMKVGFTLEELLKLRFSTGLFRGEEQEYVGGVLSEVAQGSAYSKTVETSDGRTILIKACNLPNGGRVATHEDITERQRLLKAHAEAEEQLREQKHHLDTALNNMIQGLNLFDADGRLVLCNERYVRMYALSPEKVRPGCTVRDLIEQRIAAGTFFTVDPEKYASDLKTAVEQQRARNATLDLP
ncbi:MAG TPA: PAS-domain containing protein, partial [Burkholderiaceae bacterium]|nr:PAS-domain containing protein [Burkholderiaceae bacterium]